MRLLVNGTNEDNIMNSVVCIELLAFFSANPHARDTLTGLAARINRSQRQIEAAVLKLVQAKILHQSDYGNLTIYRLRQSYATKHEYPDSKSKAGERVVNP